MNMRLIFVAMSSVLLLGSSNALRADGPGFSEKTIKGEWTTEFQGRTNSSGGLAMAGVPPGTPFFMVGRIEFDGDGHCQCFKKIVFDGYYVPEDDSYWMSESCEYAVAPDGTAQLLISFPDIPTFLGMLPSSADQLEAVVNSRDRIDYIVSNLTIGILGKGSFKRQTLD